MFQFLMVMFLIFPNGEIAMIKKPAATLEACQKMGIEYSDKATAGNVIALGTCVKPGDYIADA